MWFSYRSGAGETYRIGYARKENDSEWALMLEDKTIDVSVSGWDSEMIEYPFVFDHRHRRYMLYNGNGYGRTGFGLAVLDFVI
jgi:intein-encoded DNA endonuclease-like protein